MRLNQQGGNLAMQKKTVWMGAGAVLLLGALLAWAFAPRPQEVEVAAVVQGRFEAGIDEDARTRLRDRYAVSAPLAGRLERMALREGDAVQAGDVVARIQPALPALLDERGLREQQARVAAAQAGVQRAAVRSERSRAVLAQAQGDLRRTEQLAQQGFVAPTRLDAERLAVEVARKDVDLAGQDQQVARADLAQARAALDVVQRPGSAAGGRAFEVRAPVAGRVLRVVQASEGMVGLGTVLVEVGDTAQLEVVAPLLKEELARAVKMRRTDLPATMAEVNTLLAEVRERGAARVVDTLLPGIVAFCAPVFDAQGRLALGLVVLGSVATLDTDWSGPAATALLRATRQLSADLGHLAERG